MDVLHVHFGFDQTPPEVLREVAALLAGRRIPLVVTVHDLENPHFADSTEHRERLRVLVGAASAVVTLTPGAAREVERLWGRSCVVLPHPHVLPIETIGAAREPRASPVVAIHAKALRANIDPWPVLEVLLPQSGTWRLRLDADEQALGAPRSGDHLAARLERYRVAGVDVRVHPRFSDDALRQYLSEVDVLVLPYRFGTHSGWVEACYDAGVCAVVPDCGHFAEQQAFPVYRYGRDGLDADSLRRAVTVALAGDRPAGGLVQSQRRKQRQWIRDQMTGIYRQALSTSWDGGVASGYGCRHGERLPD
jgi:hypothetical protein